MIPGHYASMKRIVASALTSLTLLTTSVIAQSTTTPTATADKQTVTAQSSGPSKQEKKVAVEAPKPADLAEQLADVKAENAAFRETLLKMQEQQKTLLEMVDRLQRKIDGGTAANSSTADQPASAALAVDTATATIPDATEPPQPTADATVASPTAPVPDATPEEDRYRDGILIWQTDEDSSIPFQLRFTNITQFRYLNTLGTKDTFTDHLGNVRTVAKRNDLTVNREMFTFTGFIFDKRLRYNILTWTSAATTQVVVSGNVGWQFNKAFTLTAGYWSVPGTRSLVFTFPYFTQPERSLADNFFRPGFTQGIWATGEPLKGLNYEVFIGNGLNTLTIPTSKIDTNLVYSTSVWWEPNGPWGPDGKSRNMYDDYFYSRKPLLRFGSSFTRSREDRFSNLDQSNPENTSIHNSDGVLAFSTGAFAPGVTLEEATYRMWAIDGGMKWRGLAINSQYYFRWLNDFLADGPLPVTSTFDHGGELSASYFLSPKKFMVYGRGSAIAGQFGDSYEWAGGFKWYFIPNQRVWLNGEIMRVNKAAYGSTITPYTGGMTGWVPVMQTIFSF